MADYSRFATITRQYPGQTVCSACGKRMATNQPAYYITDTARGYADGTYHRRCAGDVVLGLVADGAGLDAPVALADPSRVLRDSQQALDADVAADLYPALGRVVGLEYGDEEARTAARRIATRLGLHL